MIEKELTEALRGHGGGLRAVISVPEGAALAQKTFQSPPGHRRRHLHPGLHRHRPAHEPSGPGGHHPGRTVGPPQRGSRRPAADAGELRATPSPGRPWVWIWPRPSSAPTTSARPWTTPVRLGFASVLLIGHLGKLTKLAAGITDTHSRTADGRREVFVTHAGPGRSGTGPCCGGSTRPPPPTPPRAILEEAGLQDPVLSSIARAVGETLTRRAAPLRAGAILFSPGRRNLRDDPRARRRCWKNREPSATRHLRRLRGQAPLEGSCQPKAD